MTIYFFFSIDYTKAQILIYIQKVEMNFFKLQKKFLYLKSTAKKKIIIRYISFKITETLFTAMFI